MAYKLSNFMCNRKIAPIIPNNSFTFREPSVIKAKKKKKKKKNNSSIKSHQFRKLNVSFPFSRESIPWLHDSFFFPLIVKGVSSPFVRWIYVYYSGTAELLITRAVKTKRRALTRMNDVTKGGKNFFPAA